MRGRRGADPREVTLSVGPGTATRLARALETAAPLSSLVLLCSTDADAAETALLRETRIEDWVGRHGTEIAVVLTALPADLDAVADRLLSVVERATGAPAAAGLTRVVPGIPLDQHLDRARRGLAVAWACGGSRAVRYP